MAAFNYNLSITGDCGNTNNAIINLYLTGGTAPYTVEWQSPLTQDDIITFGPSVVTGLSASTYAARVNDSTLPINEEFYINVPISSGVCTTILAVQNTTCNLDNGSVIGTSTTQYSSTNFYLLGMDNTLIQSGVTNTPEFTFGGLSAGTYYMLAEDLGGCSGRTQSFIIDTSEEFSFGLYVVPNSSCGGVPIGKITVTGQTGLAPFTYLWNNGQTGSTITGLTKGNYSVAVIDAYGCTKSMEGSVTDVNVIGLGLITSVSPSCLQSNGSISLTITGGTAPFYYSASTGNVEISYGRTFSISGLSAGDYNFQVTDAGFCQTFAGTTLLTPGGITSVSVNSQNSTCSSVNGSIQISVVGGAIPYTYTLVYPSGAQTNINNSQTTQLFNGLVSGTYTVAVSDNSGCSYIQEITIMSENKFTISTDVVSTSCNQNNGQVTIYSTTGGTLPLDYSVDGIFNVIDTNLSAVTFNNLSAGTHTVSVTDSDGCIQTSNILIPFSQRLDYSLFTTSCGSGNSGQITAFISSGEPPFSFNWSDNVPNEPQQIQVIGLTGGSYSLTVVDANGCTLTRNATITCNKNYVSYQTYVMGAEVFNIASPTKFGLLQMLNEGFYDLTTGNTGCELISATFTAKVSVNPAGLTAQQNFFTSTSLVQAPSDNTWYNTVKSLLLSIPGVGNVIIDQLNNQITIETSRNNTSLEGQEIVLDLVIVYDIICLT
jgi:large repetitive protein